MIYIVKKKRLLKRPLLDSVNRQEVQKQNVEHVSLSRSGRTMRTIDLKNDTCSIKTKIWDDDSSCRQHQKSFTVLEQQQILAEIAYVLQPLLHLSSMATLGPKSWTPWVLSFGCDLLR